MAINPLPATHGKSSLPHRQIGELLEESGCLTQHDVKRVVAWQRKKGLRFGEAAQVLGLATDDDIQRALAQQFNYPYMRRGESGLNSTLVSAYQPFSAGAESFRMLRSQLALRWFDHGNKVLAVGAPRRSAGCSLLAANLAVSYAQLGERTLLLDANLRDPAQHILFGMSKEAGLADVLRGRCAVEKAVVSLAQLHCLAVLCAGPIPPNPHELLSGRVLRDVLDLAREIFDVIIIDTPPALEFADTQMLAARAGGYLLVARRNRTRLADVHATQEQLAPSGAVMVGAVVND